MDMSSELCARISSCIMRAILWASICGWVGLPLAHFLQKGKVSTCCCSPMFLLMTFPRILGPLKAVTFNLFAPGLFSGYDDSVYSNATSAPV